MSWQQALSVSVTEQARREREAANALGVMLHTHTLSPDECAAIGMARAALDANARANEHQARELVREEQLGVRA